MKLYQIIILTFLNIIFFPFVLWNLTFGFVIGYILLLIFILGLIRAIKKKKLAPALLALLGGFVIYLLLLPVTMPQMNKKTASYQERVSSGEHLNFIEKWNIYGLSITASLVAYPFFPEVSKEFLLMLFPTDNDMREFRSGFFMKSQKMQEAFKNSNKGSVEWYQKHYNIFNPESRIALALNPCKYEIKKTDEGTIYKVIAPVRYPKRCRSTMLKEPVEIRVEEGLFRYLEDEGWLFGYDAIWTYIDNK
jgi:hypothetical protein